ncbi:HK97-gp10 family putative phage morphogenesis protein [Paenibacillus azoreducens]|uniref:HK97-gp10 family putative phage morphogenesis protein n=1 Tax=Paenibacillus azoreducens TaxID=116718 RepID=UPI0039F631B5
MQAIIRRKIEAGIVRMENQGLKEGGEIFAEAQREKVPVSSIEHLHMKDDIKVSSVRRGDGIRFIVVGQGKKTRWRAHFSEFGTKNQHAEPFIYPAFHENKDRVAQLLADMQRRGMAEG